VGKCDSPRRVSGWYVTLQEVVEMAEADTMVGPLGWWTLNKVPRNRLLSGSPSGKPHIRGYRLGL
jgi:hypothetical protein